MKVAPEGGGNTGSNFAIQRLTDWSAYIDNPMSIARVNGVATFTQPIVNGSDISLKDDVRDIANALGLVRRLRGVHYIRKSRPERREYGLIAQEVERVIPEMVDPGTETAIPAGGGDAEACVMVPAVKGLAYTQAIGLLIEAVKTLAAKVEALEASADPDSRKAA